MKGATIYMKRMICLLIALMLFLSILSACTLFRPSVENLLNATYYDWMSPEGYTFYWSNSSYAIEPDGHKQIGDYQLSLMPGQYMISWNEEIKICSISETSGNQGFYGLTTDNNSILVLIPTKEKHSCFGEQWRPFALFLIRVEDADRG